MALSAKKVNQDISKDRILSKVSEEQLFSYYIPSLKKFNKPFKSEIRKDENPSCIVSNKGNHLIYHDFTTGDRLDIWNYIMSKYKVTYFEALNIINNDFKTGFEMKARPELLNVKKESVDILYRSREWSNKDIEYWLQFGITKAILEKYWVKPLECYWINDSCFKVPIDDLCYLMPEVNSNGDFKIKLYCPLRPKGEKFPYSNDGGCIYGLKQLPETGDVLFITSSKKDIMSLFSLGYPAISFTAESSKGIITLEFINYLRTRFKKVYVFYDYDITGIKCSKELVEDWKLNGELFTEDSRSKDPSDYIKNNTEEWLKLKIKVFLENN